VSQSPGELLVIPSIDCGVEADALVLDKKFVSGMTLYQRFWPGPVRGIVRAQPGYKAVYSGVYQPADLGFAVTVLGANQDIADEQLRGSAIVLGAGDDPRQSNLLQQCRSLDIPCVLGVEYTLGTRIDIIRKEARSSYDRLKGVIWALGDEVRRRRRFKAASGLQINGAAAFTAYAEATRGDLLYFDNRLAADAFASDAELARAEARREAGEPLRLLFSGRLERMKGADHLVPVIAALRRRGVGATLDIFGTGSLVPVIAAQIDREGLGGLVTLQGPVDYETELLPRIKGAYDVFICCHPQSDPSCTYVETLGCGIPIAGYRNDAFAGILDRADVGWGVPIGKIDALAAQLHALDSNRAAITSCAASGLAFARQHGFEAVFQRRIDHLLQLVQPR
jgi:glycosyltransferase involved in cell wall biosynthesis